MRDARACDNAGVKSICIFVLAAFACHHDPAPAEPVEKAPPPSSSGTPVGYLVDAAGALALEPEQVVQIREIDRTLVAQLAVLDKQPQAAPKKHDDPAPPALTMTGGRHGGGRHGGGHRAAPAQGSANAEHAHERVEDQREADVHDALQRAFAVLTPKQQEAAQQLLEDRGVDLDTDDE